MSVAEAKRGYPVKLRGIITYYNPYNTNLVVQDDSAGIYVRVGNSPIPKLQTGQLIDLDGFTSPGDVAPVITAPRIKVMGAAPMPPPMPIDPVRFFAGADDSPVDGGGRHRRRDRASRRPHLHRPAPALQADRDGHPRRAGAAGRPAARARQGAGRRPPRASTSAARCSASRCGCRASTTCSVVEAAKLPPVTAIAELLQFTPSTRGDEPSAVQGVVLLTNPTGPTWLSDDTGGVLVATHARGAFAIGDVVRATGFAEPGAFNPVLRSAALIKVGAQPPPPATPMTLDDIFEDGWDAKLAQVEGFLTDCVAYGGRERLTIVQGTRTIVAELPDGQSPRVEVGSLVKVTGVSVIDAAAAGNTSIPRGVTLYLRVRRRHRGGRQPAVVDGAAHARRSRWASSSSPSPPWAGSACCGAASRSRPPTCARPRTPPRRPARPRASSWPT